MKTRAVSPERASRTVVWVILTVILSTLVLSPAAESYSWVFRGSPAWNYMEKHRSRRYAKARVSVMTSYFKAKNPGISTKAARTYASLVEAISRKYGVDPFLVSSIIVKESTVKVRAKSGKAYGLMQINWKANRKWIPRVFPTIKSSSKLLHSRPNIYVGCYMLRDALKRGGNVDKALDIYRGRSIASYRTKIHRYYSDQVDMLRKKL